jgi:hypothetical protein
VGTTSRQAYSEEGQLVATYCLILMDYTTEEAVLAGLLNDYRLVMHRLPLRTECDYVLIIKSGSQFVTSERENYCYWSKRLTNAAQDSLLVEALCILRMEALINYPSQGHYLRYLASRRRRCCSSPVTSSRTNTPIIPKTRTTRRT